jgi:hypothetical protein
MHLPGFVNAHTDDEDSEVSLDQRRDPPANTLLSHTLTILSDWHLAMRS